MLLLNPSDMPTPELKQMVQTNNDMLLKLFGKITIRVYKEAFYPWQPRVFRGN